MKLLIEKPTLRQLENPVLLVKNGREFIIKNEAGDLLMPTAGTLVQCIEWCNRNHCLPLRNMNELAKYDGNEQKSIGVTLLIDYRSGKIVHACRDDHYEGHEDSFNRADGEIVCTEEMPVELANILVNQYGMTSYEITMKGYDSSTSDTDDLIKWVLAPHERAVRSFLKHQKWPCQEVQRMSNQLRNFDDGVDLVLNSKGEVIALSPDFNLDFLAIKEKS